MSHSPFFVNWFENIENTFFVCCCLVYIVRKHYREHILRENKKSISNCSYNLFTFIGSAVHFEIYYAVVGTVHPVLYYSYLI